MIKDNIECDYESKKLDKTTENMLNSSKDSSPCTETRGDTVQIPDPDINIASSNNLQSNPPPPPPSLFLKFVKRVAICTAVVAIVRYTYPILLVINQNLLLMINSMSETLRYGCYYLRKLL